MLMSYFDSSLLNDNEMKLESTQLVSNELNHIGTLLCSPRRRCLLEDVDISVKILAFRSVSSPQIMRCFGTSELSV